MITGVLPTALTVSDMERSLTFYRDLLGFKVVEVLGDRSPMSPRDQERWHAYHEKVCGIPGARIHVVKMEAPDGSVLELIEYTTPKERKRPPARFSEPGVAIVPFRVRDAAAVVRNLREHGVRVVSDPVPFLMDENDEKTLSYTTYLYDPDGNPLCLFEVPSEEG